jgi:hypothetical protein
MSDGRDGFDFLHGRWRVRNERLARRLCQSNEWQEFAADNECRPLLGGLGNLDRYVVDRFVDGRPLEGLTLRLFDPATRAWSIHWADDRRHRLDPPVVGGFDGARGTFVGDDVFDGRPIRVRFYWTVVGRDEARWEQAFSDDGGATWETNWRMFLTRQA